MGCKIFFLGGGEHPALQKIRLWKTHHIPRHAIFFRSAQQICKQVVTRLLSSRYQDMFPLFVLSCCDKSGTSCYHLFTRLMHDRNRLAISCPITRLIQAVLNKLLRACCRQFFASLLQNYCIFFLNIMYVFHISHRPPVLAFLSKLF